MSTVVHKQNEVYNETYAVRDVRKAAMASLRSLRPLVQRERVISQQLAWFRRPLGVAAPPVVVFPSSFLFPRREHSGGKALFRFGVVHADWLGIKSTEEVISAQKGCARRHGRRRYDSFSSWMNGVGPQTKRGTEEGGMKQGHARKATRQSTPTPREKKDTPTMRYPAG